MQGYYNYPLEKTSWRSLQQIARAGLWLVVIIGAAVIFLRLQVPSRSVLIFFCVLAPVALIAKERLYIWNYLKRLEGGESAERIILAGETDKAREIINTFSPSQKLEIRVVETVDLETAATSALVEAIHRHNVGRVVLAFSRIEGGTRSASHRSLRNRGR